MSTPTFTPACVAAYRAMSSQESEHDYFVCGFSEGVTMELAASGRGGLRAVVGVLDAQFRDKPAVAMFRVTAVDDRGNTVSYRTKLVHCIYAGPGMPVMKRAAIGAYNKAFKEPFTFNLAIQTNDTADLDQAGIEKSLRASGGAHQPSHFDFSNESVPGAFAAPRPFATGASPPSPRAADPPSPRAADPPSPRAADPPSPRPRESGLSLDMSEIGRSPSQSDGMRTPSHPDGTLGVFERHVAAFDAQDLAALLLDYSAAARLICTDCLSGRTSVHVGPGQVGEVYVRLFAAVRRAGAVRMVHLEALPDDGVVIVHLELGGPGEGGGFIVDTFRIAAGKIVVQTVCTNVALHGEPAGSGEAEDQPAAEQAGSEPPAAGFYGFNCNESDAVRRFVARGGDVNAEILSSASGLASSKSQWKPPLHWAARLQSRPCVELLLQSGADRAVRDAFAGQTAFELATQESAPADVLSLLRPPTPAGGPLLAVLPGRGHVATAAVLELARDLQGCRVRVVVRDVEKKDEVERLLPAADDRLQVVVADLSDYASVLAALQGADRVLLSPPSAPDREALATAGIEAARACGAQHLVMVSVAGCGAGEEGRVAVWDEFARLEAAARGSGVPCTFMRAGEFMENLLGGGAAAGQIAGNQGDGRVASVCAADVGAACAAVLRQGPAEHAGKAYVLTGPGALSKPEVAQVLSEVLGLQVEYVDLSPEEHAARLRGWQVPEFVVQIVVDLQEAYKLGAESAAVSGDLMELIGRQTSLREFAETHKDALLG